jgi:metal-dependent amidase/aminoacylase/carboxypeptidase family protein
MIFLNYFNFTLKRKNRLPLVARLTALSFGATAEVVFTRSFAAGSNNSAATRLLHSVAQTFATKVEESDTPCMGSEDFFEFGLGGRVPAAMFWLGGRNEEKGFVYDNHNSLFDVDESCLPVGAATLAAAAIRFCRKGFLKKKK